MSLQRGEGEEQEGLPSGLITPLLLQKGFAPPPAPVYIKEGCVCLPPSLRPGPSEGRSHTLNCECSFSCSLSTHSRSRSVFLCSRSLRFLSWLTLVGSHRGITVLGRRTLGRGRAGWKCLGWRVNYSHNRGSDERHELEEFSFTWPPASIQAVSHDIL